MPDQHDSPAQAHAAPGEQVHAETRHEKSDVKIGGVVWFGIWFVVVLVVIHVLLWGMYTRLGNAWEAAQPKVPFATERPRFPKDLSRIPAPRLETDQTSNIVEFRKEEEQALKSYRWVDEKKGVVRIPVARAVELLSDPQFASKHGLVVGKEEKR